jgi:hypothetical protein
MMSSAPPKLTKVCPDCGANNPGHLSKCWLCEAPLGVAASGAPFTPTAYQRHASFQFSFASLMVTIALIAVLLGAFRLAPGLGVLLTIIVAPAWIRTCITVAFRSSERGEVGLGQKAGIFAVSLAMVIGIGVMLIAALVGAFAVFCGVTAAADQPEQAGIAMLVALGAMVALGVALAVVWAAWRFSRRQRS